MTPRPLWTLLALALLAAPAAARNILIIADSHSVGPFGKTLDDALQAKGHRTALYAVCGASAKWFYLDPKKRGHLGICYAAHDYGGKHALKNGAAPAGTIPSYDDMMAAPPDLVIFALGSNGPGSTPAAAEDMLPKLPTVAGCYWVGPPPMPSQLAAIGQLYNDLPVSISKTNRSCSVINSVTLKCNNNQPCVTAAQATKDHFYGQPAIDWGNKVADIISP